VLDDDNSRVKLVTPERSLRRGAAGDEPASGVCDHGIEPEDELVAADVDRTLAQSGERERADRLAHSTSIPIAGRSPRGEPMGYERDLGLKIPAIEEDSDDERAFAAVIEHIHRARKLDFSGYRRSSVVRRIRRRMQAVGIESPAEYLAYLESCPDEIPQLFETLLINVTSFFRDPPAWQALADRLPSIIDVGGTGPVRVWSAGCSSGEEPYTIAMLLAELLGPEAYGERVKIYATDIDEQALAHARQGAYAPKTLDAVPPALVEKYFTRTGSSFVFDAGLRRAVVFGRHDLVQDAPIPRMDLLVCRNTLMYFNAEAQTRVLERLRFALVPNGVLFLGKAEMLLAHADLFKPVDLKQRIFSPVMGRSPRGRAAPDARLDEPKPLAESPERPKRSSDEEPTRILHAAFDLAPTAQIVVDSEGRLVMANQEGMRSLGLTSSDPGRPLAELACSAWLPDLRASASAAIAQRCAVRLDAIERVRETGDKSFFDVHVTPLFSGAAVFGAQITFVDVTEAHRCELLLRRANLELEATQEELRARTAELEATHAELRSTLGELEAVNQEIHCTNEELQATNEELQATNEELQTINEELRQRDAEIARLGAFYAAAIERRAGLEGGGERAGDVEVAGGDAKSMTCKVAVVPLETELKKGVIVLVEEVR
jgi:two-component system CheB/CheR fusion protein